ncbi:hypothetical protein F441_08762 [Phytophthora nicotianae CJ01A1]|uniref:Uncharacterized protein n=1 Tax=Phytophthora nicotianae CJ01A1 TaxID=1317063 RepID=W2X2V5_PHYNI|nr:hypothetical protein F441_08762 [Phytophthora nicotianae CJ01A1]
MKRCPKNKNKVKLKGVEVSKANSVATVVVQMGVHHSSVYRWRKQKTQLEGDKKNGSKFYVNSSAIRSRNYVALRSWTARFLKRNRLVIRRVTHKGSKTRNDMENVADSFANSVNVAVEIDGILPFHTNYKIKHSSLFNINQTAVFIDNPRKLTVDYCGTRYLASFKTQPKTQGDATFFGARQQQE